jgi:hypothetical protein
VLRSARGLIEFRILGPVEIAIAGGQAHRAPKQRALLALLLLHVNQVVSDDRPIEDIWGEQAPATAGRDAGGGAPVVAAGEPPVVTAWL